MTRQEMEALANGILMIDPEQMLQAMKQEQECKAAWTDEDGEQDDYVLPARNRHITSAQEWDAILG